MRDILLLLCHLETRVLLDALSALALLRLKRRALVVALVVLNEVELLLLLGVVLGLSQRGLALSGGGLRFVELVLRFANGVLNALLDLHNSSLAVQSISQQVVGHHKLV